MWTRQRPLFRRKVAKRMSISTGLLHRRLDGAALSGTGRLDRDAAARNHVAAGHRKIGRTKGCVTLLGSQGLALWLSLSIQAVALSVVFDPGDSALVVCSADGAAQTACQGPAGLAEAAIAVTPPANHDHFQAEWAQEGPRSMVRLPY